MHLLADISLVVKVDEHPYTEMVRGRLESGVSRRIVKPLASNRTLEIRDRFDRRGRWLGWFGWAEGGDAIEIPGAILAPTTRLSVVAGWVSSQIRAAGGLRLDLLVAARGDLRRFGSAGQVHMMAGSIRSLCGIQPPPGALLDPWHVPEAGSAVSCPNCLRVVRLVVGGSVIGFAFLVLIWLPSRAPKVPPPPAVVEAAMQAAGWSPAEARMIAAQYSRGEFR